MMLFSVTLQFAAHVDPFPTTGSEDVDDNSEMIVMITQLFSFFLLFKAKTKLLLECWRCYHIT